MKKRIIKTCGYIALFLILMILFLEKFVGDSKFNITDVMKSLYQIDTANIKVNYSKIIENEEQINFIYNFNYNNNYSNDNYKNIIATNGTIGFEVESLELGFYAPIQTAYDKKSFDVFLNIDEAYEDVFNISSDSILHINSNNLIKFLNIKNFENNDILLIKDNILKSIFEVLKNNKKSFTYLKNNKQNITSGNIGRLQGTLSEEIMDEIYLKIKNNISKDIYDNYNLDKYIKYIIENFKSSNIYFDIYKSQVSKIYIQNSDNILSIEINNINNPNNITFEDNKKVVEINDYIQDNLELFLELFGYDVNVEYKGIYEFKNKVNETIKYMGSAINYIDEQNYDYANICIEYIDENINDLKSKNYDNDETMKDINIEDYFNFLDILKEYTLLYKDSSENPSIEISNKLKDSVDKLNKAMNDLGLN